MELVTRLDSWFIDALSDLTCSEDAKAYIVGVLSKSAALDIDIGKESVVLAYIDAKEKYSFSSFQKLGDWSLWINSMYVPKDAGVVQTFGRLSYYTCHRMTKGKWKVYEELADELPTIVNGIRCKLRP